MSRSIAFPFLTLSDSAVEASCWEVSHDGEEWLEEPEFVPNWDASCDIRVRRRVRLLREVVAEDLAVQTDDLHLRVVVRIGTGSGRMPRMQLSRSTLPVNWAEPICDIEASVTGRLLSQVLELHTEIQLGAPPRFPAELSPTATGDRLWSDRFRMLLEGEEPRFPMEVADLGELLAEGIARDAPWYLHWSTRDWHRDFHGAVRLYLNRNSTEFLERVQGNDPQTLQLLLADIMCQICERYVADTEAPPREEAEPGSLAAQAAGWLGKAWPDKDLAFLRSVLESRPGAFRASLLALAEPGGHE